MANNNTANVSTTRGVAGAYCLSAPLGTTDVPTAATLGTWTPTSAWENLGFVSEDGFSESISMDGGESIRDVNLTVCDTTEGSVEETMTFTLLEVAQNPLSTIFGHRNVVEDNGVITVTHDWTQSDEERMYVFLFLLKNGRKQIKFLPKAKVTSIGDVTYNKSNAQSREVTLTYTDTAVDFVESVA